MSSETVGHSNSQRADDTKSKVLDRLSVAKAFNSDHLLRLLKQVVDDMQGNASMTKDVSILVLDCLISHFRREYIGLAELRTRQRKIKEAMCLLRKIAEGVGCAVLITNEVTSVVEDHSASSRAAMFSRSTVTAAESSKFRGGPTGEWLKEAGGDSVAGNVDVRLQLLKKAKTTSSGMDRSCIIVKTFLAPQHAKLCGADEALQKIGSEKDNNNCFPFRICINGVTTQCTEDEDRENY
jgi:RecA/RadA recombinase